MSDDKIDKLELAVTGLLGRMLFNEARSKALIVVLGTVAEKTGLSPIEVNRLVDQIGDELYQQRLIELEKTDPGFAARLDLRDVGGSIGGASPSENSPS